VERVDGTTRCILCGEEVPDPVGKSTRTTIIGSSGQPNIRVVMVDGTEIHRCSASARVDAT
jgi:hypothetical protein